jgi:4-alpha-glucanotransferase
MVLRRLQAQQPWWQWPAPLARRHPWALYRFDREQAQALCAEALLQWQLQHQWQGLLDHARRRGVQVIGDLPFYVAHDSADVWSRRWLFSVRADGSLRTQSGVPPDYFSATGQLWGTPVYRWPLHRLSRFGWWMRRLQRQLELLDLLRLDHFRALEAAWCVPGRDTTAMGGAWRRSPGLALLRRFQGLLQGAALPLIAEDLGVITPAVEALRDRYRLPGMKILQFAFDGNPDNPYLPANYAGSHWVVYTGTHDNATSIGWWNGLGPEERQRVEACLGAPVQAPGWQLLELALASSAALAVVPVQDLLELGDEARFNTPGTLGGNWCWRLDRPIAELAGPLRGLGEMGRRYGRGAPGEAGTR